MAAIAAMNGIMSGPLNGTDTLVSMVTFESLLDYHGAPYCTAHQGWIIIGEQDSTDSGDNGLLGVSHCLHVTALSLFPCCDLGRASPLIGHPYFPRAHMLIALLGRAASCIFHTR